MSKHVSTGVRPHYSRALIVALQVTIVVAVVAIWQLSVDQRWVSSFAISSPSAVWDSLSGWIRDGTLWSEAGTTLIEAFAGYALGVVAGVALAAALAFLPRVGDAMSPLLGGFNSIPRLIFAPFFIVWFGLGQVSKIVFVAYVVVFFVFFSTYSGLIAVEADVVNNARLLGASRRALIRHVYLPAVVVWLMVGLRLSIGLAFGGAIVAEFIGSTSGLGWLVLKGMSFFRTQDVMAAIVVTMIVTALVDVALRWVERKASVWRLDS